MQRLVFKLRRYIKKCSFFSFFGLVFLQASALAFASPSLDEVYISKYLRFFDRKDKSQEIFNLVLSDSMYLESIENLKFKYEVPIVYNDKVKNHIGVYTNKRRDQLRVMLSLSDYYFPIFEDALKEKNMPEELKYMSVIESGLNPRAVSPAGAVGLWQFMPSTGKLYGLRINSKVDERLDPFKASSAAAHYLSDLYSIFKDYTLAIAAYNCGPGNVRKAIRRSGGKRNFWAIYNYLPRETRGYVPAFIAAAYSMNYYENHLLSRDTSHPMFYTDTLFLEKDINLRQISQVLDISYDVLKDLNPQYKLDMVPGGDNSYSLRLPINVIGDFYANLDDILADTTYLDFYPIWEEVVLKHRVKRGENLGLIAKKYKVSVSNLRKWNNIPSRSSTIRVNQVLKIHSMVEVRKAIRTSSGLNQDVAVASAVASTAAASNTKASAITAATTSATATSSGAGGSASAANVSEATSVQTTKLGSNREKDQNIVSYKVKKGDTVYSICQNHPGSTTSEIVSLNKLSRKGRNIIIHPNQILKIKIR